MTVSNLPVSNNDFKKLAIGASYELIMIFAASTILESSVIVEITSLNDDGDLLCT